MSVSIAYCMYMYTLVYVVQGVLLSQKIDKTYKTILK